MSHWETQGASDEWYTPAFVFEALGETFDLDVAHPWAVKTAVPCYGYLSKAKISGLEASWHGFVWMNPPFGGRNSLQPWLDRFFAHGNGIALTPDRTSAPWFQDAWRKADAVLFTRKIRFIRPDGSEGKSPSNGTALIAAVNALPSLIALITSLAKERDELTAALADPDTVHINMLRGGIAKPSVANIIHLYGDTVLCETARADAAEREVERVREALHMYGKHGSNCSITGYSVQCDCGLAAALSPVGGV